jgi:hypothetical protein
MLEPIERLLERELSVLHARAIRFRHGSESRRRPSLPTLRRSTAQSASTTRKRRGDRHESAAATRPAPASEPPPSTLRRRDSAKVASRRTSTRPFVDRARPLRPSRPRAPARTVVHRSRIRAGCCRRCRGAPPT